jgi:short-subunit dehydrogenase
MNIIITGASRGLGYAIANRFAKEGHSLYLSSRNEVNLYQALEKLVSRYPHTTIKAKPYDLGLKEQAIAFGHWVLKQDVVPDVIVNNAGQFLPGSVHGEADGTLERMIELNLYSAYHLTRSLLPKMIERRSGHIFNMCSTASLEAYANGGSYSISKYALAGFSKNLREEMKPYGIKVTAVFPGAVYTDAWAGSGADPKKMMVPEDVADLIYTASRLSAQGTVEDIVLRPLTGDL